MVKFKCMNYVLSKLKKSKMYFTLIYFNSYAWSGSSGSGVFDSRGKFVGYIVALDVGRTEYGMDVLENVILVVPHYRIDWSPIFRKGK